ncbi:MAG: deoxyribose-phosphate aldolase [Clostridium sp.]|nr:deoxyribose-phosphate aldolase [Clostridium sp.]
MELNRYIDHTLLKADATPEQIAKLCAEAKEYRFASVCVNSCYVPLAAKLLSGTDTKVCCVVGFPLGACLSEAKAAETRLAVEAGAEEVDMVINIGMAKAGDWDYVRKDIAAVAAAAHPKAIVKVIIECCLLTDDEKVTACLAAEADVALMRGTVGADMGVKAAGGIRTYADAVKMIAAGANRLGASAGIAIMKEAEGR